MKNYTIGNVRFYGPKGMYVDYHELTVEPAPGKVTAGWI